MAHIRMAGPWTVVVCAAAIVTLSMGARQAFGLFLTPMNADLGISRNAFGFAIAIQQLAFGVVQPFVGALADRHGAGRVTVAGALLYAAGLVLAARAGAAAGLDLSLGLMVGLALAATTYVTVLGAVGRVVAPERRGLAFGIVGAGGSLGQFLVVPAGQLAIGEFGWRGALLALAALVLLLIPLARGIAGLAAPVGEPAAAPMPLATALGEAAGHSGYWLLNAGFLVCGFHIAFVATHLPAYLGDQGIDAGTGALALALIGLFNIFGSYAFGVAADRLRKKYVLSGIYFARAAIFALFWALPASPATALVFAAAIGFLWLGTVPLTSGLVGQVFGVRYLSTLYGIVFLSHQIGAFFGAWIAGLAYDRTGSYGLAWAASIALGLLAGLVHLPIRDAPLRRPVPA